MNVELWIGLLVMLGIGGLIGWVSARRGVPKRSELDALQQKLDAAHAETEEIRTGVGDHFEQSAVLFGRLAQDYRAFIEHFSESAQSLGISELRARELLEQASQPLVTHEDQESGSDPIDADALTKVDLVDPADAVEAGEIGEDGEDGDPTDPADAVAVEDLIVAQAPVVQSLTTEDDVPWESTGAGEASVTQPAAEDGAEDPAVQEAGESAVADVDFAIPVTEEPEKQKAS